jgi:hypothetical protein
MPMQANCLLAKLATYFLSCAFLATFAVAESPQLRCAAFTVEELPFRVCVDTEAPGGGFSFRGPAQSSTLGGLLFDDEEEGGNKPFYLLNTDFEAGVPVGTHPAPRTYFSLTLRWDSAGSRRNILMLEVCGPEAGTLRLETEDLKVVPMCGRSIELINGLSFPISNQR